MVRNSFTVLICDDMASNRAYLSAILQEEGYRIAEAGNGEACIEAVEREKPILVLLDVVMPGIDGFETLRRLKARRSTASSPVIMLTSLDDEESKLKAFGFGAVDYIVKTASEAEIKARARVHVRLALASEELIAAREESVRQISDAQRSLLVQPADLPEASFSVYYHSVHEAGGDFYDVVPVSDGVYFYLMADVAGHDVGTSYVTPAVKVLLKQFATPAFAVEETVAYMHGILSKTVLQENYLTAFALRVNKRAGKAVYLSAGHPPALYLPKEGEVRFLSCENPFIGMVDEFSYRSETMDISEGDRFILYTDGLVEVGPVKKTWADSFEDLLPHADLLRSLPREEVAEAIVRGLGAESPEDDVAILVVEV